MRRQITRSMGWQLRASWVEQLHDFQAAGLPNIGSDMLDLEVRIEAGRDVEIAAAAHDFAGLGTRIDRAAGGIGAVAGRIDGNGDGRTADGRDERPLSVNLGHPGNARDVHRHADGERVGA